MEKQAISDLTGYATLLGDSFQTKINLLTNLIQDLHYPSIGRYKEKLLANFITQYIPKKYSVATGFILFPKEADPIKINNPDFDPMNMSHYVLSKQCDVIIYNSCDYPHVFKDDDFVIVRPESVTTVIEIKGTLSITEMQSVLDNFFDLGMKIVDCNALYGDKSITNKIDIQFIALSWEIYKQKNGKYSTNAKKIRQKIASFYKSKDRKCIDSIRIDKLYIYNEAEIASCASQSSLSNDWVDGYLSYTGKCIRFNNNQKPYYSGDRTISSLLATIQYKLDPDNFNRLFSYTDETKAPNKYIKYPYSGYSSIDDDYEE